MQKFTLAGLRAMLAADSTTVRAHSTRAKTSKPRRHARRLAASSRKANRGA